MKEQVIRNKHAQDQLKKVSDQREGIIRAQQDEHRLGIITGEINFLRNQRVFALNKACELRASGDIDMVQILEHSDAIFDFLTADGIGGMESPSQIHKP